VPGDAVRVAAVALIALAAALPGARIVSARAPAILLLHDGFGEAPVPTPAFLRERRQHLENLPVDGLAIYVRAPDLSIDVTASVVSSTRLEAGDVEAALAPLRGLVFRRLEHRFARLLAPAPPDFFSDWSVPVRNAAVLARAIRQAGLRGVYFDNENYVAPWGDYPSGVAQPRRTLRECQDQARRRGRELMRAMVREFPEIVFLTLHGPYISDPRAPAPLFPPVQGANELLGPFFAGLVEGAGPRATCVDGGELYHLRADEEFEASYAWRKRGIASGATFLPRELRSTWSSRVSVGFGVYDRPFAGRRMDPATLHATLARALRRTDRYVWLYLEGRTFLTPEGAQSEWREAVERARRDAAR
jgi:hypothetical protein